MQTLTRQQSIFVRYAPVLLIVSLVWFALTLQYPPISLGYILAWFGVGLAYGVVEFVGSGSRYFRILNFVSTVIVLGGLFLIPNMVGRGPSGWFGSSQGMAILFVCVWTLNWTLGRKMKRRLAMGAVEQIVGREAR
jgi:hypothetical protein